MTPRTPSTGALRGDSSGVSLPLAIVGWYSLTLISSIQAKLYFAASGTAEIATALSMTAAVLFRLFFTETTNFFSARQIVPCSALHLVAVYLTYISLHSSDVWFTYSIKALEPVSTALISWVVMRRRPASPLEFVHLVTLVIGVVLVTVKSNVPMATTIFSPGCLAALASNLASSTRAVLSKKIFTEAHDPELQHPIARTFFLEMSTYAWAMSIPVLAMSAFANTDVTLANLASPHASLAALTHAGYFLLSFQALGLLEPTSHAVANAMKRVFVTVIPAFYFHSVLHPLNWVGVVLSNLAAYLYASARTSDPQAAASGESTSRGRWKLIFGGVLIFLCGAIISLAVMSSLSHLPLGRNTSDRPSSEACVKTTRGRLIHEMTPHLKSVKRAVMMGEPRHMNLGDTFIWLGSIRLLTAFNIEPEYLFDVWDDSRDTRYKNLNVTRVKTKLGYFHGTRDWSGVLWMLGGGNWGTLWPSEHAGRAEAINALLKQKIRVVMSPQSVYYTASETKDHPTFVGDRQKILDGLDSASSKMFVFCHRWKRGYDFFVEHFPEITNLLTPDTAFGLGFLPPPPPLFEKKKILFLLRDDKESDIGKLKDTKLLVQAEMEKRGLGSKDFLVTDWMSLAGQRKPARSVAYRPDARTNVGAQLVSAAKVVVTDRLHASIMALLLDKPHVYIDTPQNKTRGTRDVALVGQECSEDQVRGYQAFSLEEAIERAMKLVHS